MTELRTRVENPADYMTVLAYLNEKGQRINHEMEKASPPTPPRIPRRR